uniref:Uncharacterized protein n=1 Tax=Cacopsylla melanoneura TaxID=428564 RepID=A0A8D8XTP6_9HEMI
MKNLINVYLLVWSFIAFISEQGTLDKIDGRYSISLSIHHNSPLTSLSKVMTTNVEISLSGRYYKTRHKVMGLFNTLMTGWATAPVAQMCLHEMDWLGHQWPTELPISNLVVPLVVGGTSYLTVSY